MVLACKDRNLLLTSRKTCNIFLYLTHVRSTDIPVNKFQVKIDKCDMFYYMEFLQVTVVPSDNTN